MKSEHFNSNEKNLPVDPIGDLLQQKRNITREEIARTADFLAAMKKVMFEEFEPPTIEIDRHESLQRTRAVASLAQLQGEKEARCFNLLDYFPSQGDELLDALVAVTSYFVLSPQQQAIALASLGELATKGTLTPLMLAELWSETPTLHDFSVTIRKTFCF